MNKRFKERLGTCVLTFTFLVGCGAALARVIDITLKELVQRSSYIAYGRSVISVANGFHEDSKKVRFQPISVLKGKRLADDQKVTICNDPHDVESYDLRVIDQPYVVFARTTDECHLPIQRLRSVVKVDGDTALTRNIADQPETQSLSVFLKKVESLVGK